MTLRVRSTGAAILAVALLAAFSGTAWAGESSSQATFGDSLFAASPPCPVKQFPTFESLVPVPKVIDPFVQDLIPMFCQVQVNREGKGVRKAKGRYEVDLVVVDNNTGTAESFPIKSGRIKTNSSGSDSFDFDLPAELFADGFESGDVSAWSYTRTDFSNNKKANNASVSCGTSGSKSN